MNRAAVYHQIDSDYCYGISDNTLLIKLRAARGELTSVRLFYLDKFTFLFEKKADSRTSAMDLVYSDTLFDYFETRVTFDVLSMGYAFHLESDNESLFYADSGFIDSSKFTAEQQNNIGSQICYLTQLFTMPVLDPSDLFTVPVWAKNSIAYQIFVDRFYRGDSYQTNPDHGDWYGDVNHQHLLGGTLQGVIDKIPYLVELGVTLVYLSPIFQAEYSHKYCTQDYFQIDADFGSLSLAKQMVDKLHQAGIRVVLDAVFSSCGVKHAYFQELLHRQQDSEYQQWFKVKGFPIAVQTPANYHCFGHIPILPKFNFAHPPVQDYFLEVLSYWTSTLNLDGWRLDVADEIPHAFWKRARQVVKAINADALLIGEVWYDSRSWLKGDEFDTVMNYRFYTAVVDYLVRHTLSPAQFADRISCYLANYKKQTHRLLWNLIGSHDTARFSHLADNQSPSHRLAAVLQFTLVGTPMIYYGDEIGMSGGADPDNRRGMRWDTVQNQALLKLYKKLIALRKSTPALRSEKIRFIHDSDQLLHFMRGAGKTAVHILINNSRETARHQSAVQRWDLLSASPLESELVLPAFDFKIYQGVEIDNEG